MRNYLRSTRGKAYVISYLVLFLGFILWFGIPTAEAKKDNKLAMSWIRQILEGVPKAINETFYPEAGTFDVWEYIKGGPDETSFESDFMGSAQAGLATIAILWVLILLLAKLPKTMERGEDPVEAIAKLLIELCVDALIIMYVGELIRVVIGVGESIINLVGHTGGTDVGDPEIIEVIKAISKDGKEKGGTFWQIDIIAKLLLPFAISYLMQIAARFLAYQIMLEIAIRKFFAPLAVADIYAEGLRSPGVRYFKKLLATLLKFAIALLTCMVANKISVALLTSHPVSGTGEVAFGTAVNKLFICVVINVSALGAMFKGGEIANDITGA